MVPFCTLVMHLFVWTSYLLISVLCSNAIKFTHEGKVGIKLYVVTEPYSGRGVGNHQKLNADESAVSTNGLKEENSSSPAQSSCSQKSLHCQAHGEGLDQNGILEDGPRTLLKKASPTDGDIQKHPHPHETTVWIRCDVYDTGIGIPGILIFMFASSSNMLVYSMLNLINFFPALLFMLQIFVTFSFILILFTLSPDL